MLNSAHLRLRLRLAVETVTVQQAREALAGMQAACGNAHALWAALHTIGYTTAVPGSSTA